MRRASPKLTATKPKNVLNKPLNVDLKGLFKALAKGVGHTTTGKWEELASDTIEAMSAIGAATEPEELAFLLVRRSITLALFELIGESASGQLARAEKDADALVEHLDFAIDKKAIQIDKRFLDRPSDLPLLKVLQPLVQNFLEVQDLPRSSAKAIVDRLPSYFVYALNQEWRRNAKSYRPLLEALDTPFSRAGEREWAWNAYNALLQRRVQEGIFEEPFSLSQMYVPLNAFYFEEKPGTDLNEELTRTGRQRRRIVVSLQRELEQWLQRRDSQDTIRVVSGGPGSGKSTFARIFAARLVHDGKLRVLFVPLHLIDASKELVDEVGRFVRDEGVLLQNPLDPESPEPNFLIVFDGLDELASQGKAAAETARAFVREVERTLERRNHQSVRLRVLISGRELVVQENESEFRRPGQILSLLPYFVPRPPKHEPRLIGDGEQYHDPEKLLKADLRQQWWKNYGVLTGKDYTGLPKGLSRADLEEITAQPLLNYLVALSFTREKLDFTRNVNLNSIYADLVTAVHERAYEKHRPYGPIRHMKPDEFSRVLEEVGLAAWHGDGRSTTVREIEEHCRASGLGALLDVFQEGAKAGVTRLLAAFFFRQYGARAGGDPTFVFTHKSFGEYLTARRVVRAIGRVIRELERRSKNPDEGWDEREALKHWVQICGSSAITRYLHVFLLNEVKLRPEVELVAWQGRLSGLFSYMLRHGMPIDQLQIAPFKEALFQSRNAEEALLVALNACARMTEQISAIEHADPTAFGAWFRRIQGQRTGPESVLAAGCLSFLDLSGAFLDIGDFYGANFSASNLRGVAAHFGCFATANFTNVDLRDASLGRANLESANFETANLGGALLTQANLTGANLKGANLKKANLKAANLVRANLEGANFEGANLEEAKIDQAKFDQANLKQGRLPLKSRDQEVMRK